MRKVAGAAGLAYVIGVSIENMEVLEAPTIGDPVAEIRANYADQAFGVVTSFAGVLALVAYVVFAIGLFQIVRGADRRGEGWALAGLAGGIAGPTVAATGAAATAILVAHSGTGLSDDVTRVLFDYHLVIQMVAGVFVALFLAGFGVAALRTATLPEPLAWSAIAIAAVIVFSPLAALTDEHSLQVAVTIAFGLDTLWVFAASMWLALAEGQPLRDFVRRGAFLLLAFAAGLVGIGLIAAPGATGKFFAWGLQAWAWVVLFAGFSLVTTWLLVSGDGDDGPAGEPLAQWVRAVLAVVSALLAALALALWIDPTGLGDSSPYNLPPLGGRFAGSWVALLAVLTGWAAIRNTKQEAWLPCLALAALPGGGLIAALRTIDDLDPAGPYVAVLIALIVVGVPATRATRASARPPRSSGRPAPSARS